jgi:uncharacterized protein (TIGR02246 family)
MKFICRATTVVVGALVVSAAGGCAQAPGGGTSNASTSTSTADNTNNTNKAAVDAILKADRDFNQAVANGDLKHFLSFIAEGATFNGGTPSEIRGRDAIAKDWAPFFEKDGPRLTWVPTHGEVLGAGDLGYTVGTSEYRTVAAGQTTIRRGQYLTVWRKQTDGVWLIVYDTGSTFKE